METARANQIDSPTRKFGCCQLSCSSALRSGALGWPETALMPRPGSSVVERGPEKAGVGGSIPSLATTL